MPPSLFCGACFSYIIPPPVTVCQVVFGIFFRRMQKNRSDQEKIVSSVKPGKKGRCTASRTAALFVLRYFHSFSTCLVFIFCLLMFPFCRPHQPGKQKPKLTPRIKPTMPAANTIAPPPFFYHILPYIICRMQSQPVAKGKITAQHASFFAPERCKTLPHLLYF